MTYRASSEFDFSQCGIFAIFASAAILASCTSIPTRPLATPVVVIPSEKMRIATVRVEARDSTVLVAGRFARRPFPPDGDLIVEAWGPGGILASKKAQWYSGKALVFRTNFSARLSVQSNEVAEIRIRFTKSTSR